MLTEILEQCAEHGVDDIHIIVAVCLHRHMTGPEIKRAVGDRIYREYYPERLYNHDAEDLDNIVEIGQTPEGHRVRLNRRAVESDLLIYVNINLVPMDGGHKSVTVGLCDYISVSAHHNTHVMHKCHSYMDPRHDKSELSRIVDKMGDVVDKHLNVFHIETAINNRMFGGQMAYLMKHETRWNEFERAKFQASCALLERLPEAGRRAIFEKIHAPYGLIAVHAGKTAPVHQKILDASFKQYAVPVKGQADVLVTGIPFISPYNVNSILNPLLVQVMALGYLFNFYRNAPLIKKGGVMIVFHPLPEDFNRTHHPSYVEFYHRILSISTQSRDIHRYEKSSRTTGLSRCTATAMPSTACVPSSMVLGRRGRARQQVIVCGARTLASPGSSAGRRRRLQHRARHIAWRFLNKPAEITMSPAPRSWSPTSSLIHPGVQTPQASDAIPPLIALFSLLALACTPARQR
ncbi:MAG: DUF2088 domain-containing protein [Myxococcales bacterium]|nr:DUF2088 domain-containing protein [Myxococcales bacterium]